MKYLLFVLTFSLGWLWSSAQTTDSTMKKRRRDELIEQLSRQRQAMSVWREQRRAEAESRPHRRADSAKWSLTLNPFSILEPQAAAGLGVGYQINPHWQVWLESSWLFQLYSKQPQSCIGGIRESLAVKYYFGLRQSLFFAAEFRYKDVFYHDVANFDDNINLLPVYNYSYKLENIIFGGAGWFGGKIRLSDNHRWLLEPSVGVGLKGRTVVWHGVPDRYTYQAKSHDYLSPIPENPARVQAPLTVYLPATIRLVYVL